VDDTLPGAALRIVGQNMALRDSLISNLASGAAGSLIVQNSSLVVSNSSFIGCSQAGGGALFLNGSRATVYNSVFERNRGARCRLFPRRHLLAGAACSSCGVAVSGRVSLASDVALHALFLTPAALEHESSAQGAVINMACCCMHAGRLGMPCLLVWAELF
jgi:hypothetical protein